MGFSASGAAVKRVKIAPDKVTTRFYVGRGGAGDAGRPMNAGSHISASPAAPWRRPEALPAGLGRRHGTHITSRGIKCGLIVMIRLVKTSEELHLKHAF